MKRFDNYLIYSAPHSNGQGIHKLYRFANNYGASVVKFLLSSNPPVGSYGAESDKWELAVIKYVDTIPTLDFTLGLGGEGMFEITYDTPITDDVLGHLTDKEVGNILQEIKDLKDGEVREDKKPKNED